MKQNKKLALLMAGAAILGSSTSLMAAQASKGEKTITDTYVPSQEMVQNHSNFVRTSAQRSAAQAGPDLTYAAETSLNSVVSIKSFATPKQQQIFQGNDWFDPFEFFFGPGYDNGQSQRRQQRRQQQPEQKQEPQAKGLGSGVIISDDGYIVTNNHVVDGAEKLEVTLNDNRKFNAKVVGTDANTDIALLKIDAKNLSPITFGNSDNVKVGQWVLAVGNPFGLNSTVTAGIVSAKARGLSNSNSLGIESFIQHDAAVNPGNSGGALVNAEGELIGINTMIYSQTGSYAGYSFAIPSSVVKKIVTDIKQYGSVQRAVLGISITDLDADKAKDKGITATAEGVYVAKVEDRSAAKEAGIEEGDAIVKLNGHSVKNSAQLLEQMSKLRPGDKVPVEFYHNNKLKSATVTLKNNQGNTKITKAADMAALGCGFQELTDKEKKDLDISNGVKVVGLRDGKFKAAGIKSGFVITDINNMQVNSRDDVESIYGQIMRDNSNDKVMFITGLYPTGKKVYYAVDLSD